MNELLAVLLSNAVTVVPIAIAAWITMRLFRRPAIAHVLWVLVLIKLLTPPLVSPTWVVDPNDWPRLAAALPGATNPSALATRSVVVATTADEVTSTFTPSGHLPAVETGMTDGSRGHQSLVNGHQVAPADVVSPSTAVALMVRGLLMVWVIGSLLFLVRFARRIRLAVRLVRASGRQDSMASALAESLFGDSFRAPPRVVLVDAVISPTLIGIGPWTRILFPRRLWQDLPAAQRDGLLIHELEHYRRGDHWVRVLESMATTLFWWHPVIWWARHQIEITEESCCDAVASGSNEELSYAEALLTTLDFINEPCWSPSAPVGTGVSRLPVLEQRLKQIVRRSIPGRLSMAGRVLLLVFASLALPVQPLLLGGRLVPDVRIAPSLAIAEPKALAPKPVPAVATTAESSPDPGALLASLPPAPEGWWTKPAPRSWAHAATEGPDAPRLIHHADGTLLLQDGTHGRQTDLSDQHITAAAFWKGSTRLVTGDTHGQVRLWDVASGEPVSLLGRHRAAVTSLAISSDGTLVTGADDGSVITWDLQSGDTRATWTTNERPIQSVRLYDGGSRAVVIASDWRALPATSRIVVLDTDGLTPLFDWVSSGALATSRIDQQQLTFLDWAGKMFRFASGGELQMVGSTDKEFVSAFVFSQDARLESSPPLDGENS